MLKKEKRDEHESNHSRSLRRSIDLAMVRSINDIGHVMGIQTIAEGVESEVVLERLREIGVDYAQGFALGPPTPIQVHSEG